MSRSLRPRLAACLVLVAAALPLRATLASSGGGASVRVVGGEPAPEGRYPFVASLQKAASTGAASHFCGGSLVDPMWVLTAAHCVDGMTAREFRIAIGVTRLSKGGGQVRNAVEIRIAPAYDGDATHGADVALVQLSTSVEGIDPVRPVLPTERSSWEPGDTATVLGWGVTTEAGATASDQLLTARLPIQPDGAMAAPDAYGASFRASDMLGAGPPEGGADACFGDSGGPLIVWRGSRFRQVGIVSFGRGCGRPGFPGIYARLGEGPIRAYVDSLLPQQH